MNRSEYDANLWLREYLKDEPDDEMPDTSGLELMDEEPVGYDPRNYRGAQA